MEQLQRFLSTVVIVSLYNVGLLLRFLIVHLLNIVIYARFRHAASEKQLIAPLVPADLVLEKRNNHIGVCLKKIKFD